MLASQEGLCSVERVNNTVTTGSIPPRKKWRRIDAKNAICTTLRGLQIAANKLREVIRKYDRSGNLLLEQKTRFCAKTYKKNEKLQNRCLNLIIRDT